jgi:hypothetical protein
MLSVSITTTTMMVVRDSRFTMMATRRFFWGSDGRISAGHQRREQLGATMHTKLSVDALLVGDDRAS